MSSASWQRHSTVPALVTGASGFLGGRVAQRLLERGDEVSILARPSSDLRHLAGTRVRVILGSLSDRASLHEAVQRATQIYHCAACSTDWAPYQTYVDANVRGTQNLLEAARRAPLLQRFLHVSTTDIYGYPETPCTEERGFVDAGLPYNQTKGAAEAAVWTAHADGLPVTILRPATIYGPRGRDFTQEIATLLRQRLMAYVGGGRATGGFTYVDSIAQVSLDAAEHPRAVGEAYNITDGTNASWCEYTTLFAQQLGTKPPWINLSFNLAMRLSRVFEGVHRLLRLPGRPLLTRHAALLLGRDQEFPAMKARREIGFRPAVSLEAGIERSVAWLADAAAPKRGRQGS